jgi:uncharacterized protein (UPF0254 family)
MKKDFRHALKLKEMIRQGAANGIAIAELECIGLCQTAINILENHNIIYLADFLELEKDLNGIRKISTRAINGIRQALKNFDDFEQKMKDREKSTPKIEIYKKTASNILKKILA